MLPKIRKVLLLRPPLEPADRNAITDVNFYFPPYGIALLSAVLARHGYEVSVKDMYNEPWAGVSLYLRRNNADLVGISCISGQHFGCLRLASLAKELMVVPPVVVLGGPHPSAAGIDEQILLNYPQVDFIVRNEGEVTFPELLEAIQRGSDLESVMGLSLRLNGRLLRGPDRQFVQDLDSLPFADFSSFNFTAGMRDVRVGRRSASKPGVFAPIISSRGCPNRCQFCSSFMGGAVRFRSPENVVAEIESLVRSKGIRHFAFVDDCFNASLERAEKICRLLAERNLGITWSALARVKPLSEEFLVAAKASGCIALNFGIESGSPVIRRAIGKSIEKEEIIRAFRLARELKIDSAALLMVGNPGETPATISQTIALLRQIRPGRIDVSPLVILPNSELHARALSSGLIGREYWLANSSVPYYTAEHSKDRLRYFRLKIIFWHSIISGDIALAMRSGVLLLSVRLIGALGLDINGVRDFIFRMPLLRYWAKNFKTA